MESAKKSHELVLFTAASKEYADAIVDALESGGRSLFSHRLYREHCSEDAQTGQLVKDLTVVADRSAQSCALVDDNPVHVAANPGRSI